MKCINGAYQPFSTPEMVLLKGSEVGLLAQEVREVLPEAVKEGPDGKLGLNYNSVVSVLLEAVKSLTKRIEDLENKE